MQKFCKKWKFSKRDISTSPIDGMSLQNATKHFHIFLKNVSFAGNPSTKAFFQAYLGF